MKPIALVLGGAGFIGSHLTQRLVNEGYYKVVVVDLPEIVQCNPDRFHHSVTVHGFDLTQSDSTTKLINSYGFSNVEVIYMLASPIGVENVILRPGIVCFDSAKMLTNCYLPLIKAFPEARIIYASSSEVYGENNNCCECDTLSLTSVHGRFAYASSKLFAESCISNLSENYCIVRPFNITGPGQSNNMVIPYWVAKALLGNRDHKDSSHYKDSITLPILGDGSQVRSFCDINPCTYAFHKLAKHSFVGTVNVGMNNTYRMVDAAELVSKYLAEYGYDSHPEVIWHLSRGTEEIRTRVVNNSLLCKLLPEFTNLFPIESYNMEWIVKTTISYWRNKFNM